MAIYETPKFLPAGDRALVVELANEVDADVNRRVIALDARVIAARDDGRLAGIVETVPTYRSLMVHYDPLVLPIEQLRAGLEQLLAQPDDDSAPSRLWRVPVTYGGEHGVDLTEVAAKHNMTEDEVVAIHSGTEYRVYMIGFVPGYCYLGGLDPRLHTPRRTSPRAMTPAGSVAVGGIQTGIASVAAPSGWNLLGRTPMLPFDPKRDPVFLIAPGDRVRFQPVPAAEFDGLSARAEAGEWLAEIVEEA